jgi:hypothetical protein
MQVRTVSTCEYEIPSGSAAQQSAQTGQPEPRKNPEKRKKAIRVAVYRWRETHPDEYKALCRKSSHAYYVKHRDEISERRRKEREAVRYVAEQKQKEELATSL